MAVLMSDQGSEWQGEFHAWCVKNGVIRRTTTPGSSEQNSRCERKIRALRENCTANIFSSGIPIDLWPEAWMYTCHTIDHLPQAGQGYGGQAPLTISRGARPSLARTMPFGCAAYEPTPPAMRRKADFSGRARLCVFLGYDSLTKDSYRLLHLAICSICSACSIWPAPRSRHRQPLGYLSPKRVSPEGIGHCRGQPVTTLCGCRSARRRPGPCGRTSSLGACSRTTPAVRCFRTRGGSVLRGQGSGG
jgi:hypothetical protein